MLTTLEGIRNRIVAHYPTEEGLLPHGVPTKEDAQQSLAVAENVFSKVTALIG